MLPESDADQTNAQTPSFFSFLTELLQLYALRERPTQMLLLNNQHQPAMIWLDQGRVVNAKFKGVEGKEAFFEILRWPKGHIQKLAETTATEANITENLSQLLLDAYWEVMDRGVELGDEVSMTTLDGSQTLAEIALLEQQRKANEHQQLKQLDQGKLKWGERLREEIKQVDGLISYNVLAMDQSEALRRTLTPSHQPHADLAEALIQAMSLQAKPGEPFNLMLTVAEHHHILIGFPQTQIVLHGVFERAKIQLAMAHWKLSQFLPDSNT